MNGWIRLLKIASKRDNKGSKARIKRAKSFESICFFEWSVCVGGFEEKAAVLSGKKGVEDEVGLANV